MKLISLGLNSLLKQVKYRKICLKCCYNIGSSNQVQLLRFLNVPRKSFEGPSFQDFLMQEQTPRNLDLNSENLPFVNEVGIDGENRKVLFEVAGCQMNHNDAEVAWSILKKHNYQKTNEIIDADIVLIITCAIRDSAEVKIWRKLQDIKTFKTRSKKKNLKVGLLGCMAERLKSKVLEIDKTVDLVAGPDSYKDLPRLLALTRNNQQAVNVLLSLEETYADIMPVRLNENSVSAFISIMRGCDNMCTYCIVPFTRGRERSRPINSILDEVRILSDQGVKQITLLGQNVNSYRDLSCGQDLKDPTKQSAGFKTVYKPKLGGLRFYELLDKVSLINPEMRIRFTSPHPKDFPDEVLHLMKERKNICCSLHLPAQSGSSAVLERMRRGYTKEAYIELVKHIRQFMPNICFTTDIITGFCGETEKDHEETLELIKLIEYTFVFVYPYSQREKTTAHRRLIDDLPKALKQQRADEVGLLFRQISDRLNKKQVNQIQLVLVDGISKKSDQVLSGRNDGNIKVLLPAGSLPTGVDSSEEKPIKFGDYVAVRITEGNSQGLKGTPLYHTTLTEFDETQFHGEKYEKVQSLI